MSKRQRSPRLEPRPNLSPPRAATTSSSADLSPTSSSSSTTSPLSIRSSEGSYGCSEAEVATRAMLLVGCPQCLMYVMLSQVDPKCPKCKSTVLLDFLNYEESTKKTSN